MIIKFQDKWDGGKLALASLSLEQREGDPNPSPSLSRATRRLARVALGNSGSEVPSWCTPLAGPDTRAAALEGRLRKLLPGGGGIGCFACPCGQWVVLTRSAQYDGES